MAAAYCPSCPPGKASAVVAATANTCSPCPAGYFSGESKFVQLEVALDQITCVLCRQIGLCVHAVFWRELFACGIQYGLLGVCGRRIFCSGLIQLLALRCGNSFCTGRQLQLCGMLCWLLRLIRSERLQHLHCGLVLCCWGR